MNKFKNAFNGIKYCLDDKSIRIQLIIFILVIIVGFILKFNYFEWIIILILCFIVVIAEIINTCIEKVCDLIDENENDKIKVIKDMSAAFVLISSICAVVVGMIVMINYIWRI